MAKPTANNRRRFLGQAGAALGALFLGFIANALILVGLSQFWLQAIYGLVILVAVGADTIILRRIQRATAARRIR